MPFCFIRSVRRWKDRLDKFKLEGFEIVEEVGDSDHPNYQGEDILTDEFEDQEHEENCPVPKKRKFFVDRDKVEYAKELIENKLSNKDMGLLLEMSIACVRKLKMKILNGSVDELIDNNEEYYRNLESGGSSQGINCNFNFTFILIFKFSSLFLQSIHCRAEARF